MSEELNTPGSREELNAENDFLKMKLMLEHGAVFGQAGDGPQLPAEIENDFLKRVAAFEKQSMQAEQVKVFNKIGRPTHFKPVGEIPDDMIAQAWVELSLYLNQHEIELDVCSPNISDRELYRFTTEELFDCEMTDIDIPGMITHFIYDEFYPDPVYDNTRMVKDDLFRDIFRKEEMFYEIHYERKGFKFNGQFFDNWSSFKSLIGSFKSTFEEIFITEYATNSCEVNEAYCLVKGMYAASATTDDRQLIFKGVFEVKLIKDELGYWNFCEITIGGFDPQ